MTRDKLEFPATDPRSFNGRTTAFDAVNRGSNPRWGTITL